MKKQPNEVSKRGIALAKQIAPVYFDNPKVRAVMVGGSVSQGCADHYSDLDISIIWSELPSNEERKVAITQAGGELWAFDRDGVTMEHYGLSEIIIGTERYTGTAMISVQHLTIEGTEKCLADVVEQYDTNLDKQSLLSAIRYGIPLHGTALLKQWQAKIATYPDKLAIKMVQENLWLGPWFCPQAYAERDDLLVLYQHFIWVEQGLLKVLAGLNRVYYPSPEHKWMDWLIGEMRIVPPNFLIRLRQIFSLNPVAGWQQLKLVIDETLALVERHLPEVDTIAMFEAHPEVNLTWARQRWTPDPPYTLMSNIGLASSENECP